MSWDPKRSSAELRSALVTCDWDRVARRVDDFVAYLQCSDGPYPEADARSVLTGLRRKRRFDLVCATADALIQSGAGTFHIRQDYAQALLDGGLLVAARAVLEQLVRDTEQALADPEQPIEARGRAAAVRVQAMGLIGRLYKQWYVNSDAPGQARNGEVLLRAIAAYWDVYREDPSDPERRWHCVNAIALALRAQADGVRISLDFDPRALAKVLVDEIRAADANTRASLWDSATAMEASLADGEGHAEALRWAERYVADPNLDAFEVASTERQLLEVWRFLPSDSPRDLLVALLEARRVRLSGGQVALDAAVPGIVRRRQASLQGAIAIGSAHALDYCVGLERALSVARVEFDEFFGVGTGVVVRGGDLCPSLGDERVLLACAHVVAQEPAAWQYAARSSKARVSFLFGRAPGEEPFRTAVSEVIWQSGPSALDACVLRLAALPDGIQGCPLAGEVPACDLIDRDVCLAGYPRGASMEFSFTGNVVVDGDETVLYYRAETEKGSSGSAVFDERFALIALHHAGRSLRARRSEPGFHAACEGVRISAIANAMQHDLGSR